MKLEQLRPHARTLKERTYEHQPTALPHGIPVGIGQGYSTIALIPSMSGSWALPLRHERITSWDNPIAKGAEQLAQVCEYLTFGNCNGADVFILMVSN